MNRVRIYLLYSVVVAVVLYSTGVLYRVQQSVDLGIECLFTNQSLEDAAQLGPEICRSDLTGDDVRGPMPHTNDVLQTVAGQPITTFLDFRYRIAHLRAQPVDQRFADEPSAGLETERGRSTTGPHLVQIGDQRWVRIDFERVLSNTEGPPRWSPLTTWLRVNPVAPHVIGLSIIWFALEMMLLAIGALVYWKRPGDWSSLMFFALCVVNAITFFGAFHWPNLVGSRLLVYPFVFCAMLLAPLTLHFYLLFPRPLRIIRHWPRLTLGSLYALPVLFIVLMFTCLLQINALYRSGINPPGLLAALEQLSNLTYAYLGISVVLFVLGQAVLIYGFFYSRTAARATRSNGFWQPPCWPASPLVICSTPRCSIVPSSPSGSKLAR